MATSLRCMTAVYLRRGEELLLLYRIGSRVVGPTWCGIGGHFEPEELHDPQACVLRELREETGLTADLLSDLRLRYVAVTNRSGEVRENFYFFAELLPGAPEPLSCSEGILEWVPFGRVMERDMPVSAKPVVEHWLRCGRRDDALYAGVLGPAGMVITPVQIRGALPCT